MLPVFFIRSQGLRKLYCGLFTSMLESWGLTQLMALSLALTMMLLYTGKAPDSPAAEVLHCFWVHGRHGGTVTHCLGVL